MPAARERTPQSSFLSRPGPPWSIALRDPLGGRRRLLAHLVETRRPSSYAKTVWYTDFSKPGPSVMWMRTAASTISLALSP